MDETELVAALITAAAKEYLSSTNTQKGQMGARNIASYGKRDVQGNVRTVPNAK